MSLHHLTYRKCETHWRERKLRVHPPICTAVKLCILFFHHAALPVSDEDLQQLCGGRANLGMVGCVGSWHCVTGLKRKDHTSNRFGVQCGHQQGSRRRVDGNEQPQADKRQRGRGGKLEEFVGVVVGVNTKYLG